MANVELRSVRNAYGAAGVLHGVSIDVKEGEFATLVGPSGCGKSTLLRMIAGLESITGGEIRIGGRAVNNVPPDHLPSEDVVYGVRPEHFMPSAEGLPLTVAVVAPTGSETQVIARHGSQSIVCLFRDRALPQVGETIRVMPDVSRIHLFKENDGRRLS